MWRPTSRSSDRAAPARLCGASARDGANVFLADRNLIGRGSPIVMAQMTVAVRSVPRRRTTFPEPSPRRHHRGGARAHRRRIDWLDLRNMLPVARIVAAAALRRTESRGAHQREDFPGMVLEWQVNQVVRLDGDGRDHVGAGHIVAGG